MIGWPGSAKKVLETDFSENLESGLDMMDVTLFPSERCTGYFGTKRFDRVRDKDGNMQRIHMLTVSGMLETSHRIPNLDYHLLMKLTLSLTKDYGQIEQLFRQICFNVLPITAMTIPEIFHFCIMKMISSGKCHRYMI